MNQRPAQRSATFAFTLVEILVSMSVLAIIVVFVTELVNATQRSTSEVLRHLSTDAQARLVFDRMENDFNRMLKRADVDYVFYKAPAAPASNDAMFFFTQTPASVDDPAATHGLTSLVGYRINSQFQLERLGKLLNWDGSAAGSTPGGVPFLTFSGASMTPIAVTTIIGIWGKSGQNTLGTASNSFANGTDIDYSVLSDGVFRFSFGFLTNQTTTQANSTASTSTAVYVDPPPPPNPDDDPETGTYPFVYSTGMISNHVTAIVVTLAILDQDSRKLGAVTQALVTALPNRDQTKLPPNSVAPPMAYTWNAEIVASGFAASAGLNALAAARVRVYERTFYLSSPSTTLHP